MNNITNIGPNDNFNNIMNVTMLNCSFTNIDYSIIARIANQLIYLNCSYCPNITANGSLPDMPNLQTLICNSCDSLIHLPNAPSLIRLECRESGIHGIPLYHNLKYLDCSYCNNINAINGGIAPMPKLEQLITEHCDGITIIGTQNLPSLKLLNCSYCSNLTQIHTLSIDYLICNYCPRLRSISMLHKVISIRANMCQSLTNLGIGDGSNTLRHLEIIGSPNIVLERFPKLEYLYIHNGINSIQEYRNHMGTLLGFGKRRKRHYSSLSSSSDK
jgi:hypothetical protein